MLEFFAGFLLGAGIACVAIARVLFKIAAKAAATKPVAPLLPIEQRPIFLSPETGVA
jgi:hypothetical protein